QGPGIRLDSGIEDGDEITQYYDPMIAKLIVTGEDRPAAVQRLQTALQHTALFGVTTNLPLLLAISKHSAFQAGHTHTSFLAENHLMQLPEPELLPDEVVFAAALSDLQHELATCGVASQQITNPWKALGPWRMLGEAWVYTFYYHETSQSVKLR